MGELSQGTITTEVAPRVISREPRCGSFRAGHCLGLSFGGGVSFSLLGYSQSLPFFFFLLPK